jgi:hypothetical protein
VARRKDSLRVEARRRGVSVHRVRVDRARAKGFSTSQARGHPRTGEPPLSRIQSEWTQLPGAPISTGTRQAGRMARLSGDIGRLTTGQLSPESFNDKWANRRIGTYEAPTAAEALAHARAQGPSPDRPYRRLGARAA